MKMIRLFPLLFTIFLDSLGFGLVFPIFSSLIMNADGILSETFSLSAKGLIFGALVSSFCVGQFFGGPILGALSDRKGSKVILLITLYVACGSYILAALAIFFKNITLLFLTRILNGIAAGNYAVAQSMIVEWTEDKKGKAKNFGILGMAWGTGFIIGPYFGGKLCKISYLEGVNFIIPFFIAAVLCILNVVLLMMGIKETKKEYKFSKISLMSGIRDLKKAFFHPSLRGIFFVMFIFNLGWGFFTEFSPLFLIRILNFTPLQIGNFYACVGIWIAVCQGLLIRPFVKRYSASAILNFAFPALSLILPLILLIRTSFELFCILPFLAFTEALIFPNASTIVSNLSSKEKQGEIFGIHNSIQWAAIGVAPMFSGSLVALYPYFPIIFASVCMLVAFIIFLKIVKKGLELSRDS